jgi:6-phosphofructokinase 2
MTDILTVCMNPAIDISTAAERVEPIRKLRCAAAKRDPGGGGINVARVAQRLGAAVAALYPSGGLTGLLLRRLLDHEGVSSLAVETVEETRQDFTVLDRTTNDQYRFVLPGPQLAQHEWQGCLDAAAASFIGLKFMVASGSLPPGVPADFYARLAGVAKKIGAKFVLDSSGAPLRTALDQGVYLVKPNLNELNELSGKQLSDEAAWLAASRALIEAGGAEVVALTLGGRGALLVTRAAAWRAPALPIKPVSAVGAGDSFLGGMVWSLASDPDLATAFRYANAAGSAAVLAPGTELCRADEVKRLLEQVNLQRAENTNPPPRANADTLQLRSGASCAGC